MAASQKKRRLLGCFGCFTGRSAPSEDDSTGLHSPSCNLLSFLTAGSRGTSGTATDGPVKSRRAQKANADVVALATARYIDFFSNNPKELAGAISTCDSDVRPTQDSMRSTHTASDFPPSRHSLTTVNFPSAASHVPSREPSRAGVLLSAGSPSPIQTHRLSSSRRTSNRALDALTTHCEDGTDPGTPVGGASSAAPSPCHHVGSRAGSATASPLPVQSRTQSRSLLSWQSRGRASPVVASTAGAASYPTPPHPGHGSNKGPSRSRSDRYAVIGAGSGSNSTPGVHSAEQAQQGQQQHPAGSSLGRTRTGLSLRLSLSKRASSKSGMPASISMLDLRRSSMLSSASATAVHEGPASQPTVAPGPLTPVHLSAGGGAPNPASSRPGSLAVMAATGRRSRLSTELALVHAGSTSGWASGAVPHEQDAPVTPRVAAVGCAGAGAAGSGSGTSGTSGVFGQFRKSSIIFGKDDVRVTGLPPSCLTAGRAPRGTASSLCDSLPSASGVSCTAPAPSGFSRGSMDVSRLRPHMMDSMEFGRSSSPVPNVRFRADADSAAAAVGGGEAAGCSDVLVTMSGLAVGGQPYAVSPAHAPASLGGPGSYRSVDGGAQQQTSGASMVGPEGSRLRHSQSLAARVGAGLVVPGAAGAPSSSPGLGPLHQTQLTTTRALAGIVGPPEPHSTECNSSGYVHSRFSTSSRLTRCNTAVSQQLSDPSAGLHNPAYHSSCQLTDPRQSSSMTQTSRALAVAAAQAAGCFVTQGSDLSGPGGMLDLNPTGSFAFRGGPVLGPSALPLVEGADVSSALERLQQACVQAVQEGQELRSQRLSTRLSMDTRSHQLSSSTALSSGWLDADARRQRSSAAGEAYMEVGDGRRGVGGSTGAAYSGRVLAAGALLEEDEEVNEEDDTEITAAGACIANARAMLAATGQSRAGSATGAETPHFQVPVLPPSMDTPSIARPAVLGSDGQAGGSMALGPGSSAFSSNAVSIAAAAEAEAAAAAYRGGHAAVPGVQASRLLQDSHQQAMIARLLDDFLPAELVQKLQQPGSSDDDEAEGPVEFRYGGFALGGQARAESFVAAKAPSPRAFAGATLPTDSPRMSTHAQRLSVGRLPASLQGSRAELRDAGWGI